jgi:uncharacterized protein with GYD domain
MARYLLKASYTLNGVKGVLKEGGTGRRDAVAKMTEALGGKVEGFYFAFGDTDAYVIAELPNNTAATAIALSVNSSGGAQVETVVLLTPEEVDEAAKTAVDYRPPGE